MHQTSDGSPCANTFALAYRSKSVTDMRSELGIRADKCRAVLDAILTPA